MLAPLRTSVDTIATQASTASNGISIWCARALDAAGNGSPLRGIL